MKVIGIIPARFESSRFPGKPLALIKGKTMIERVYEGCMQCTKLSAVLVATDDMRIYDHVIKFGGKAVLTSTDHQTGTSRISEVAHLFQDADILINIQGDEPLVDAAIIESIIRIFEANPLANIATLLKPIFDPKLIQSPNIVKCVTDQEGRALYFSRHPIPYIREEKHLTFHHQHIGIYGFRRNILLKLVALPRGILEKAESLEQLRWMEYGYDIYTSNTDYEAHGVDIPEDIALIENLLDLKEISY